MISESPKKTCNIGFSCAHAEHSLLAILTSRSQRIMSGGVFPSQQKSQARWSIPTSELAEGTGPQPRPQESQIDSQRRLAARWSQTRSRWSIPNANLANSQVIPPLAHGKRKKGKGWRFLIAFFALAIVAFTSALDATSLSITLPVYI